MLRLDHRKLRSPATWMCAANALVLALVLVLVPRSGAARTWWVAADGSGDVPTIQAALDSAQSGDEVVLRPGTYTWTAQGAAGTSMLRAGRGIRVRGEAGRAATILDAESQGRILLCTDVGRSFEISDLTFQNGRAPVENVAEYVSHGGAIDVRGTSEPTILRCTFVDNVATGQTARGGAIFCDVATIADCQFVHNRAGVRGTGLTNGSGGAVWCGNASIARSSFSRNAAWGAMAASGGAVRATNASFADCDFDSNTAHCPGGPTGGAVRAPGSPRFDRCVFRNNGAYGHYFFSRGGAVDAGSGTLADCRFIGNIATCWMDPGQGSALSGTQFTARRCVFAGNLAERTDPPGPGLGTIYALFPAALENCTLIANSGASPDGVAGVEFLEGGTVHATLVTGNGPGRLCSGGVDWVCCDTFGNAAGDALCGNDGGGNFSADPGFCSLDPTGGEVEIHANSPCAPGQGAPQCALVGAGAIGCAAETVQPTTWSAMKNLYRAP